MTLKLVGTYAAVSLLLGAASPSLAEEGGQWVDPPAMLEDETVTYPPFPLPSVQPASPTATPPTPPQRETATSRATDTGSSATPVASKKGERQRKATRLKDRKRHTETAVASDTNRKRLQRATTKRQAARSADRGRRVVATGRQDANLRRREVGSVREALDAGFTVTTVRTFYLPDGRRVEVVTELDPVRDLGPPVRPY